MRKIFLQKSFIKLLLFINLLLCDFKCLERLTFIMLLTNLQSKAKKNIHYSTKNQTMISKSFKR